MDQRKQRERHFHDHFRGELQASADPKYTAYRKWYVAGEKPFRWLDDRLERDVAGKRVLDYACGAGWNAIKAARAGAEVVAFDISERSVELARANAAQAGVSVDFCVLDAEETGLDGQSFDLIVCAGVLHHMELERAYPEMARLLRRDGQVLALECLGHNALINWYRARTPYLRSPDEHPLLVQDLDLARRYFREVNLRYFNLASLAAAPLWKSPLCQPVSGALSALDNVILRVPALQRQAWVVGAVMTEPLTSAVGTVRRADQSVPVG